MTTGPAASGIDSAARRTPTSSPTLLVAVPRNSNPSFCAPSGPMTTNPAPAGPGFPEHAPSVYAIQPPRKSRAGSRVTLGLSPEPRFGLGPELGFEFPLGAAASLAGTHASSGRSGES